MERFKFSDQTMVKAVEKQVSCEVDGEVVILDMVQGVYFGLNSTGAYVWQLVQSPRTVGQLVDALLDEFDVSPDRCRREVDELLGEFIDKGLVAIAED